MPKNKATKNEKATKEKGAFKVPEVEPDSTTVQDLTAEEIEDLILKVGEEVEAADARAKDENKLIKELVKRNAMLQDMLVGERAITKALRDQVHTFNYRRWRFKTPYTQPITSEDAKRLIELETLLAIELGNQDHPLNQMQDTQVEISSSIMKLQKELYLIDAKYIPNLLPPAGCEEWLKEVKVLKANKDAKVKPERKTKGTTTSDKCTEQEPDAGEPKLAPLPKDRETRPEKQVAETR